MVNPRRAWKRRTGWAEPMTALGERVCVLGGPRNPMRVGRRRRKTVEAVTRTLKTLEGRYDSDDQLLRQASLARSVGNHAPGFFFWCSRFLARASVRSAGCSSALCRNARCARSRPRVDMLRVVLAGFAAPSPQRSDHEGTQSRQVLGGVAPWAHVGGTSSCGVDRGSGDVIPMAALPCDAAVFRR